MVILSMTADNVMKLAQNAKCHECMWRQEIPGDAHIQCVPRGTKPIDGLVLAGATLTVELDGVTINAVEFDPVGVLKGYVLWPINFDPIWLRHCFMFSRR